MHTKRKKQVTSLIKSLQNARFVIWNDVVLKMRDITETYPIERKLMKTPEKQDEETLTISNPQGDPTGRIEKKY
jgi:hypothetical protein